MSFMKECAARIERVQEELGSDMPNSTVPGNNVISRTIWDPSQLLEGSSQLEGQEDGASSTGQHLSPYGGEGALSQQPLDPLPYALRPPSRYTPQEVFTSTPCAKTCGTSPTGSSVLHGDPAEGLATSRELGEIADDADGFNRGYVAEVTSDDDDISEFDCISADGVQLVEPGVDMSPHRYSQEPYVAAAQP